MSNFQFGKEHAEILNDLVLNDGSFLVYYKDATRANLVHTHWVFVPRGDSKTSLSVSDDACNDLVKHGILVPTLSDKEYATQCAVGTQHGRVYTLAAAFASLFKNTHASKLVL